jgi:cobalamin biosynthesis protein CbiG
MPAGEDLRTLAAPGASLAIYLSISRMRHVVDDLLASGGYTPDTPVAVYHKVTWPDESSVLGRLADIVEKVRAAGYTKHALILVSPALDPALKGSDRRTSSHLYDKSYTHRFRRAEGFKRGKERKEAQGQVKGVVAGEKHLGSTPLRTGTVVIALTKRGSHLALDLATALNAELALPQKFATIASPKQPQNGNPEIPSDQLPITNYQLLITSYSESALTENRRRWPHHSHLVLVMPSGVAIRAIAPLLGDKSSDPAVICLDEAGQSVIPLLGGHQAGANDLARRIADLTGGQAAITTASDVQGKPALDLPPTSDNRPWFIDPASALTHTSASLVNDETLGLYLDPALPSAIRQQAQAWLGQPDNLTPVATLDELDVDAYAAGLIISHRHLSDHYHHLLRKSVLYRPPVLVAGLGCKRDVPETELRQALDTTLQEAALAEESLSGLATADLKADEAGLLALAATLGLPLHIVESSRLRQLEAADFSPSAAQEKFDLPGVAEPCALLVTGAEGQLLVPKRSFARCAVAIAIGV